MFGDGPCPNSAFSWSGQRGSATVDFFARDGSLIAEIVVNNLADDFHGFSRDGGIKDIAGITITNTDPAGIGFDNLKHDVKTDVGTAPEPATIGLLGLALLCVIYARRRSSGVYEGNLQSASAQHGAVAWCLETNGRLARPFACCKAAGRSELG